jgi:hypothetical protein
MKAEKLFTELTSIAQQLGVEIRDERGDFTGGWCKVDGESYIFLNHRHDLNLKNAVLARALAQLPLDKIFILPAVREFLDKSSKEE